MHTLGVLTRINIDSLFYKYVHMSNKVINYFSYFFNFNTLNYIKRVIYKCKIFHINNIT